MEECKRIDFIDLAKGFCIVLVVLDHVNTYFNIDYPLKDVLVSFRMPLYFVLSGMFFKTYEGFSDFIKRKINNLLVPFFFFYITLSCALPNLLYLGGYSVRSVVGWESLLNFVFYDEFSNCPIWFLLCLFWINMMCYKIFANRHGVLKKVLISFFIGFCGYILGRYDVQVYMWLDAAMTAMPFFCFGYVLKNYTNVLYPNKWDRYLPLYGLLCFGFVCLFAEHIKFVANRFPPMSFFNLYSCGMIGTMSVLFLSKHLKRLPFISYWGRYSIIILCIHHPVIQIVLLLINKFNINAYCSLFLTLVIVMFSFFIIIPIMKRFFPYVTAQKNLIPIRRID